MALALRAGLGSSGQHPLIAALQNGLQTLFQSPSSILELFPPIMLAVPKSKVSHSRKRMRAANKHLQEKQNIVTCGGCGRAKQSHHLCPYCYSQLSRGFKSEAKQLAKQSPSQQPSSSASSPSSSTASFLDDPNKSPAESGWAKARGGAKPVQEGQLLTKWMRARLGYTKMDPKVRLGQEESVLPRKPRRGMWQQQSEKDQDNDDDDHSTGLPPNLRFA